MSDLSSSPHSTMTKSSSIMITAQAARRILEVMATNDQEGDFLRVSVTGGGCQGFSYHFAFERTINENDRIFEKETAKVVVDEVSLTLLEGSEIDFVKDLMGQYFKINNPNASSSCGCGTSFSI